MSIDDLNNTFFYYGAFLGMLIGMVLGLFFAFCMDKLFKVE